MKLALSLSLEVGFSVIPFKIRNIFLLEIFQILLRIMILSNSKLNFHTFVMVLVVTFYLHLNYEVLLQMKEYRTINFSIYEMLVLPS